MNSWQAVLKPLASQIDQLPTVLANVPGPALIAGLIIPILLAILSKRLLTILGVVLLEVAGCLVLFGQAEPAPTIGAAAYIGSVILALSGLAATRREQTILSKVGSLRAELNQFAEAESRRFLVRLKRDERDPPKEAANTPPVSAETKS